MALRIVGRTYMFFFENTQIIGKIPAKNLEKEDLHLPRSPTFFIHVSVSKS